MKRIDFFLYLFFSFFFLKLYKKIKNIYIYDYNKTFTSFACMYMMYFFTKFIKENGFIYFSFYIYFI
ncbi:hypothetical protein F4703DRAFT_1848456 [Phycomyces blakesleeanus]